MWKIIVAAAVLASSGIAVNQMAEPTPEIVIILDRSGSMEAMKGEMEEALNGFLVDQRTNEVNVSLVQFDDKYEELYAGRPIGEVDGIKIEPRGRTALLDALGQTLASVEHRNPRGKVIFVIITDGLENASMEYSRDRIFWHIGHMKNCHRWEFVYLGANQDAISVGGSLGIQDHSFNFDDATLLTTVDCASTIVSSYLDSGSVDVNAFSGED